MIIRTLRLNPFAGAVDRTIAFHPGLNVILGENEAGKSTVFHGLRHGLFTPAQITATRFARELAAYVPVGGGDTIGVDLEFSHDGAEVGLSKRWGGTKSAELTLADGGVISDPAAAEKTLHQLLPASPAVVQSVLMTYQSGLDRVIEALNQESVFEIREIVRQSLHSGDGFPADKLMATIGERIDEYYKRWDRKTNGPEKGRGFNDPWRQSVGLVLDTWYEKSRLDDRHGKILEVEESLARAASAAAEAAHELDEIEHFLDSHRQAAEAAAVVESRRIALDRAEEKEQLLSGAYDRWPVLENRITSIDKELASLQGRISELEKKRDQALAIQQRRNELEERAVRAKGAERYSEELEQARIRLGQLTEIGEDALSAMTALTREIGSLKEAMRSGATRVRFEAKKDSSITVKKGLDPPENMTVEKGEAVIIDSDGLLVIDHDDWRISAQPGERDYAHMAERFDQASAELKTQLDAFGFVTLSEAESARGDFKKAAEQVSVKTTLLEEALGGATLEELQAAVGELDSIAAESSYESIADELARARSELSSLEDERASTEAELTALQERYATRDGVLDLLVESRNQKEGLRQALEDTPGLPDGFDDWPELQRVYKQRQHDREQALAKSHDLDTRVAALEGGLPEESAEEVSLELAEAESRYRSVRREAETLERIQKKVKDLTGQSADEITPALKGSFEKYLAKLTGEVYTASDFSDSLPAGLYRSDGSRLTFHQLSAGIRDCFALALRLSLGDYFLSDGFTVFDDPLVDMDPERRKAAASVILEFSERHQTVVFTCHPEHAALFPEEAIAPLP